MKIKCKNSWLHGNFILWLFYWFVYTQGIIWSMTHTVKFVPFYLGILFSYMYFIDDLYCMSSLGITFSSLYQSESTPSINVNWLVCVYPATTHQEKTMICDIVCANTIAYYSEWVKKLNMYSVCWKMICCWQVVLSSYLFA
jgi:hypothetical protein